MDRKSVHNTAFVPLSGSNPSQVLLGMSGGTDSSVSAILLQEAGYQVTGVTFRFYEPEGNTAYLEEASELCRSLGIPHFVYDARTVFLEKIIAYFIQEYMVGRTPVPCTLCNNFLKWPLLAKLAHERGIPEIATGHYVQKCVYGGRYYITCGADPDKDQSFFLWGLPQEIIQRMVLPLGALTKKQVRASAQERGFLRIAQKKDSLGVCFCPMDYRSFLRRELGKEAFKPGRFMDEEGNFIAHHKGYPFYTVGQRRGLGIHLNKPVFVKEIRPETHEIILGPLQSTEQTCFYLKDWKIIDPDELHTCPDLIVKIRYRKQANRCRVKIHSQGLMEVLLQEPLTAIAPGQAAAFYCGDRVIGGGIIV